MNLIQSKSFAAFVVQTVVSISLMLATSAGFAAISEKSDNMKTIRVVMDNNYPPYVFKGDQGELKGIVVDQWRLWEKKTGIAVELTGTDWSEAQSRMQAGEFDVIDTIFRNEKRDAIYDFSKPYAQLDVPLFFHEDISGIRGPEDLKGFLVAAKAGDSSIDFLKKHGVTNITEYPSYENLLEAVRDGKAKVFTVDRPPALYFLNKFGIQNRFHETNPLYQGAFHRAVLKGKRGILTTVEAGFDSLSKRDLDAIDKGWMGSDIVSLPYVRYVGYLAAVAAVFVFGLLVWLRMLKQAVTRKTAELSKSEERLSLALNASKSGMWDWNIKTGILYFDTNYFMLSGYEQDEFPHEYIEWEKRVYPDDVGRVKAAIEAYLSGNSPKYCVEFRFRNKDGSWSWLLGQGKISEFDADGKPVRFTGTQTDISERKQAEEALSQSEDTFRKLFDGSSDAILLIDSGGVFVECNQAALDLLKMTRKQFIFLPPVRISPEFQPNGRRSDEAALDMIAQAYSKGLHRFDWTCVNAEGGEFIVEVSLMPVTLKGETMLHTSWRDITERKLSEEQLRSSEECFKALAEATFGGIIIHDKGLILECNKGLSNITGFDFEEHIGMNGLELIAPESLDTVLANIQSGYDQSYEVIGVRKDGSKYPLAIRGKNITYKGREARVIEFRDITERKRAEEEKLLLEKQILHAQKLESLGVLAGGIAHDFNNLLMAIMGNADLALMRLNPESPAVDNLKRIEQASARAADLAKQMLAYSGKGKFVVEHLDISRLVQEMLHMLEVSISKKAVLRLNLHQSLPSVEADATQMRQIIMNLVINASEAISDKSGVIAITTGCMDCDRNYLKDVWLDENLLGGLYVYLEIADSGCGMDKDTLSKLFDPFFTTKFTGRGLGMAAVLGIVRGHKGAIKVYSELNRGTTFKILLPASNRPAELFNGHTHTDDWQGSGKVLLVDDEETVRGIGREMLQELGFTVITADDGREGVAAFKDNPDTAFVILDLTMPHMDGEQCFRELRQLKPDVKVIMSSGYSEQEVSEKFIGKGLAGFIQKPYKMSVLKYAIKGIL